MSIRRYLPSAQFVLMVASLALSAAAVAAAEYYTAPAPSQAASLDTSAPVADPTWAATLAQIEAKNASSSFTPPSAAQTQALLSAAQSSNLTDSVGRTLLVNLANAKSQGLGNDIPTQNQIIAEALAQSQAAAATTTYTLADLTLAPDTKAALKAYGNGVMQIFDNHPGASEGATFVALGYATDNHDASYLADLPSIQAAYADITQALVALPVPKVLVPFHLEVVNDFARVTNSYGDMQRIITDPLRGLVGLQTYRTALNEASRVFINIAQTLSKDGILFSKDEPGSAWSAFASPTSP